MDPRDVYEIVRLSFESGVFSALGRIWKQVDGTSNGNQIGPMLSVMTELGWSQVHSILRSQPRVFFDPYG